MIQQTLAADKRQSAARVGIISFPARRGARLAHASLTDNAKVPTAEPTRQGSALIERIPASFFLIAIGVASLGMAWRAAAAPLKIARTAGDAIVAAAGLLWLALALCYAAKWLRARERARAEWRHAIQGAFVALLPGTALLVLPACAPYAGVAAAPLFFAAAAAQAGFGAAIAARWLSEPQDPDLATPAWHLAAAGGLLLAANAAASLGYKLTGWGLFGAGVMSWLLIEALVVARLVQREPLPAALRALIAVELAPPALAVVAYLSLVDGEADAFALALLGYALFLGAVLLFLARHLVRAPFAPAYWAFAFSLSALSMAAWQIAVSNASDAAFALALALFAIANAVVLWVAARTVLALREGTFLPP